MFNKVILVGNLTRGIELRYTLSGSAIGRSAIAVTRKFNVNGEKKEDVCFIDINFFGKSAEIANQYLNKGSKLLIEGVLKFEQWTDKNGQNRSKHSISVESMEMLGSKEGEPQKSNTYQVGGTSHQSQGTQRKSEPQYNDVPEIQSDYATYESYESQEIPF
jgi:single-stranded DNA-binding protein|nr:MAG TPA: Single strand binding protein [Caudoviricetes sp.]